MGLGYVVPVLPYSKKRSHRTCRDRRQEHCGNKLYSRASLCLSGDLGEFNRITVFLQKEGITFLVVATCAARDLRNDSTGRLVS